MPSQIIVKETKKTDFVLKIILFIRLFFGLYFKLSSSARICWIGRLYCVICIMCNIFIAFSYPIFVNSDVSELILAIMLTAETISNGILSLASEEAVIIDFSIFVNKSPSIGNLSIGSLVAYSIIATGILTRCVAIILVKPSYSMLFFILYNYTYLGCICSQLTSVFVTDTFRKHVKDLWKSLCKNLRDGNLPDHKKIAYVKRFMYEYQTLSKSFAATWNLLKLRVSYLCADSTLTTKFL